MKKDKPVTIETCSQEQSTLWSENWKSCRLNSGNCWVPKWNHLHDPLFHHVIRTDIQNILFCFKHHSFNFPGVTFCKIHTFDFFRQGGLVPPAFFQPSNSCQRCFLENGNDLHSIDALSSSIHLNFWSVRTFWFFCWKTSPMRWKRRFYAIFSFDMLSPAKLATSPILNKVIFSVKNPICPE